MSIAQKTNGPYSIRVSRAGLTRLLTVAVFVLLINHVILQYVHYRLDAGHWILRHLFDVDEEDTIPTWFASATLLLCAALLYSIASRKSQQQDPFVNHWRILSIGFLMLSLDEVAGFHESANTVIEMPWTIPGALLVMMLGFVFFSFLKHLPARTRAGFLIAGALFVAGAVGVEHVTDWYLESYDIDTLGYNLLTPVEEGMEMIGVVLFINFLLRYMENGQKGSVRIPIELDHTLGPSAGASGLNGSAVENTNNP